MIKSLSSEISAQRGEIDKLKRDEKSLSNLVEQLAKIIAKPAKKKIPKLKKTLYAKNTVANKQENQNTNLKPTSTTVLTNEEIPTDTLDYHNFSSLKGKLRLPVRGELVNRFGSNRVDTGLSWKGLFIRAPEGSEVKSVASGLVVFADWMRGFGNLIIVDHGSGFMSLYGNNQTVLKQVGETVSSGEHIAAVGNTGGNESNGLYYELRRQSKPFDPLSWSVIR